MRHCSVKAWHNRLLTFCNDGCIATKSPRDIWWHPISSSYHWKHATPSWQARTIAPKKIMAEWGSNAAAPLKITSEPGWSPTPTPMATRGSRRRTHRHGEADSSGSARIGNGCWWYSVCYAMPSSFSQKKGFSVSCTQCPFLSSLMGFLCRTSWQLSLLRLVLLGSAFHVLFSCSL